MNLQQQFTNCTEGYRYWYRYKVYTVYVKLLLNISFMDITITVHLFCKTVFAIVCKQWF